MSLSEAQNYLVALLPTYDSDSVLQALLVIRNLAHAYTRGAGFDGIEPNDEITSVITLATARFLRNPSQLAIQETMGPIAVDYRGGFNGWSIAERETLNRYRVQAV